MFDCPFEMVFGCLDGRTLGRINLYISVAHLDRSEVGGGLYETGHFVTHGDHTVRTFAERHDETVGFVGRDDGFGHVIGLEFEAHVFFYFSENAFHLRYIMIPLDADLLFVCHRDDDDCFGFACNRIAEVTTVDRSQLDLGLRPDAR